MTTHPGANSRCFGPVNDVKKDGNWFGVNNESSHALAMKMEGLFVLI